MEEAILGDVLACQMSCSPSGEGSQAQCRKMETSGKREKRLPSDIPIKFIDAERDMEARRPSSWEEVDKGLELQSQTKDMLLLIDLITCKALVVRLRTHQMSTYDMLDCPREITLS